MVQFTFETKPLKLRADYAVSLKVEPVEATYDSVSLNKFSLILHTSFDRLSCFNTCGMWGRKKTVANTNVLRMLTQFYTVHDTIHITFGK